MVKAMTNEEAINIIARNTPFDNERLADALDLARDALRGQEKEPCEYCKRGWAPSGRSQAEYVSDDEYKYCPMCGRPLKQEAANE